MIDVLLEALGLVAGGDEGTGRAGGGALLNPGRLGERLVVVLHPVHDHAPLTVSVHGAQRLKSRSFIIRVVNVITTPCNYA